MDADKCILENWMKITENSGKFLIKSYRVEVDKEEAVLFFQHSRVGRVRIKKIEAEIEFGEHHEGDPNPPILLEVVIDDGILRWDAVQGPKNSWEKEVLKYIDEILACGGEVALAFKRFFQYKKFKEVNLKEVSEPFSLLKFFVSKRKQDTEIK